MRFFSFHFYFVTRCDSIDAFHKWKLTQSEYEMMASQLNISVCVIRSVSIGRFIETVFFLSRRSFRLFRKSKHKPKQCFFFTLLVCCLLALIVSDNYGFWWSIAFRLMAFVSATFSFGVVHRFFCSLWVISILCFVRCSFQSAVESKWIKADTGF